MPLAPLNNVLLPLGHPVKGSYLSYQAEVMQDAPLVWYRMDEAAGPDITDSSGNGNDSADAFGGGEVFQQGGAIATEPASKSIALAGEFIVISPGNPNFLTSPFTVSMWFYPTNYTNRSTLWSTRYPDEYGCDLRLLEGGAGFIGSIGDGTQWGAEDWYFADVGGTVALNTWHEVVVTHDGSYVALYWNSVLVSVYEAPVDAVLWQSATHQLMLGSEAFVSNNFTGRLDEFRVFGTALPAARISAQYRAALGI